MVTSASLSVAVWRAKLFVLSFQGAAASGLAGPGWSGDVVAFDADDDHDLDVFVTNMFGRSALLANRGGRFENVGDTLAPALRDAGLVTAALWSDVDGDGWADEDVRLDLAARVIREFLDHPVGDPVQQGDAAHTPQNRHQDHDDLRRLVIAKKQESLPEHEECDDRDEYGRENPSNTGC